MQMNLQSRKRLTDTENELLVARGEEMDIGFEIDMCALLHLKLVTNKDLLCNTENSVQC